MGTHPRELALFAGAGGGLLGSKWLLGHRVVCYVEWNKYRQQVLQARIRDGLLDDAPIWDDVQTFDGKPWRGHIDIVTAGFPCQPFSVAGKQLGAADKHNMWPDTIRIIREVRPRIAFLENTPGLLQHGDGGEPSYYGRVLGDLAEAGYRFQWDVFSAGQVGAFHLRERVFLFAYLDGVWELQSQGSVKDKRGWHCNGNAETVHANAGRSGCGLRACTEGSLFPEVRQSKGLEQEWGVRQYRACTVHDAAADISGKGRPQRQGESAHGGFWSLEPPLVRAVHGIPDRVGQTKALGAAQVPLTMAYAYATLFERAFGHRP